MKVDYRISVDGTDVTGNFADRLVGVIVIDEAGHKADTAEITLDDRDSRIALPKTGAKLSIALGFTGQLVELGTFVVDELAGEIGPDTLTIRAKGADMLGSIRARKTRAWHKVTVQDIVGKIAGEHGLTAAIADSLKSVFFAYEAQTAESDLAFLSRLARELDAVAKPASGRLVFVKRGEGKTTDGKALPVTTITRADIRTGRWQFTGRGRYGKVTCIWGEVGTATPHRVTVGDQNPELEVRHRYPNADAARRAAQSRLDQSKRGSGIMSLELGGFFGGLIAEAHVTLLDVKSELRGQWPIKRVTHSLSGALTTSIDLERDNEEKKT